MGILKYLKGDATKPNTESKGAIIAHVCNDVGAWGAGFVLAISKRWSDPESQYHFIGDVKGYTVGDVEFIDVENNIIVANMIAQNGTRINIFGVAPINYSAVEISLNKTADYADELGYDIHMPRIGCGLAGGSWEIIELIIQRVLKHHNCDVYVYDYEK